MASSRYEASEEGGSGRADGIDGRPEALESHGGYRALGESRLSQREQFASTSGRSDLRAARTSPSLRNQPCTGLGECRRKNGMRLCGCDVRRKAWMVTERCPTCPLARTGVGSNCWSTSFLSRSGRQWRTLLSASLFQFRVQVLLGLADCLGSRLGISTSARKQPNGTSTPLTTWTTVWSLLEGLDDAGGTAKTVGRRFEVTRLEPLCSDWIARQFA